MGQTVVTTQSELDLALSRGDAVILIRSDAGALLVLTKTGKAQVKAHGRARVAAYESARVEAYGTAQVAAYGTAQVEAYDLAQVEAYDLARVKAYGTAQVEAYESAQVAAYDLAQVAAYGTAQVAAYESARVEAYGTARVKAYGTAQVAAYESARVEAYGTARVKAYGTARVEAYGTARVEAYGRTNVRAYDESVIVAGPHVAVHKQSERANITGGVVIDLTHLDLYDAATWCAHHGVKVSDGRATLYKATDSELMAGQIYRPTVYPIGGEVVAIDWRDDNDCGGGLHLSTRPRQAAVYQDAAVKRYLKCSAALTDLRPIAADKVKCRAVTVLGEVDEFGDDLNK